MNISISKVKCRDDVANKRYDCIIEQMLYLKECYLL